MTLKGPVIFLEKERIVSDVPFFAKSRVFFCLYMVSIQRWVGVISKNAKVSKTSCVRVFNAKL